MGKRGPPPGGGGVSGGNQGLKGFSAQNQGLKDLGNFGGFGGSFALKTCFWMLSRTYFLLKLFPKSSKFSACGGHDESSQLLSYFQQMRINQSFVFRETVDSELCNTTFATCSVDMVAATGGIDKTCISEIHGTAQPTELDIRKRRTQNMRCVTAP